MALTVDDKVSLVSPHQYVPQLTDVTVSSAVTVPAMSEMVITAKLDVPLKGLIPHDCAGVFEPHHTNHSYPGFAWTVAKAEQGSIYVKVADPSSEAVILHAGTRIGTFHATSGSNRDKHTAMEASVCNVNVHMPVMSRPPVLPDMSNSDLTSAQHLKLKDTLNSFSDVFSQHSHDFGRTQLVTHKITTSRDTPISQRAHRTSPAMKAEMHRQVEELQAEDLIEDCWDVI